MRRTLLVVVGAIATTMFVGACTGDSDETPTATETVTATAVATESPTPTPEATATPEAAAADAGQMLAALLHIDSAGFHGMDEALNGDAPVIETSWLGRATRARVAAEAIVWPAELQPAADALVEHVAALEAALDADDPVAAAEPAAAAHEAQHDLSHSAYEAIEAVPASASDAGAILAALVLIDGAGFHGMDEGLNGAAPEIDPSWLGDVTSARVAAQAIAWPGESQAAANAFVDAALSLEAALEADDASAAAEPLRPTRRSMT
jgi:hypothetical protein